MTRRRIRRRRADRFEQAVRRLLIGIGTIGAVYGQAEMLGEPWRHYVTVASVLVLLALLVLMEWRER